MSEKLSALVDNELEEFERAQVLKALGRDESLPELWSRYHIIGLAMRQEVINPSRTLCERVAARLAKEGGPTAMAPVRRGVLLSSAGRYAVAASVVAVLLVGGLVVKLYDGTGEPAAPSVQQMAALDDATRWEGVDQNTEDALNALLLEHGEFTSASGMNGLTAYTKFVAYDSR